MKTSKEKVCVDCGTPLTDAGPLGLYCPNKDCDEPSGPRLAHVDPKDAEIEQLMRRVAHMEQVLLDAEELLQEHAGAHEGELITLGIKRLIERRY